MASIVFDSYLHDSLSGDTKVLEDDLMCALMTSSYSPDTSDTVFDDTYEVSGTGYTAGGKGITGKTVVDGTLRVSPVTWPASSITARWAVIYNSSNSNRLIAAIDFETDRRSLSSSFTVNWTASGLLRHRSS